MEIETLLNIHNYSFEHILPWCAGPCVSRMLKHTETILVFDGYFRIEADLPTSVRPIHRILNYCGESYLIAITSMKRGKNTSVYFEDPFEGGQICLTPTELIELEYHVLESKISMDRYYEIMYSIMEEDKTLRIVNEELYDIRMNKEIAEWKKSVVVKN